jgi:hypothetical protein
MMTIEPSKKKTSLACQELWIVSECMADLTVHRDSEHDPEGRVRWLAKADAAGQTLFIGGLF